MTRGPTGHYVPVPSPGKPWRTFVPRPLPPDPPLALDADLHRLHEQATFAFGRLDGLAAVLPDADVFAPSFPTVTKAAEHLTRLGRVRELTGLKRNRVFACHAYLRVLNEDTGTIR